MEGYPLDSCNYSLYNNDTTDFTVSIMDSLTNDIKIVTWLPLISMKEELTNHMKDSVVIDEPVNESINNLSKDIIKFMKDFNIQKMALDVAEKKMKQVIQDTQRDIEVITTFIDFLSKISKQTDNTRLFVLKNKFNRVSTLVEYHTPQKVLSFLNKLTVHNFLSSFMCQTKCMAIS